MPQDQIVWECSCGSRFRGAIALERCEQSHQEIPQRDRDLTSGRIDGLRFALDDLRGSLNCAEAEERIEARIAALMGPHLVSEYMREENGN